MQQLTFTKKGSAYVSTLPATKGVVQVQQATHGIVSVTANLPDMPPTVISVNENPYGDAVILQVDVPDGVVVTIKSSTEVIKAVWM